MPAIVNSSVLSTGITLADGTCGVAARDEEVDEGAPQLVGGGRAVGHPVQVTARPLAPELDFSSASRVRIAVAALGDGGPHVAAPAVDDVGGRVALPRPGAAGASTAHDEPRPSAKPTTSQKRRLNI